MRQQVLKALANPARIFFVPYTLAVLNFAIQFMIFIFIFVGSLLITNDRVPIPPLYFLISVIVVHFMMIGFSEREPQIANILVAKIKLFKLKIPKRLMA
jgi:type IV secretory pathway VirB3-like protein